MKKLILVLLYITFCFPSHSQWKEVVSNNDFREYLDLNTVKKINQFIYMWSLRDYKNPQENGNLSTKYYTKYDCHEMRYEVLSIVVYDVNMGRGRKFKYLKNIYDESAEPNWIYQSEKDKKNFLLNTVCKLK
tara:strand:+ start:507 stop:902 length:396 start_codon:yes stop_codon:yes gene_type:complete